MKKLPTARKLVLSTETIRQIRQLDQLELRDIQGGMARSKVDPDICDPRTSVAC
jgi:hypothetical protein